MRGHDEGAAPGGRPFAVLRSGAPAGGRGKPRRDVPHPARVLADGADALPLRLLPRTLPGTAGARAVRAVGAAALWPAVVSGARSAVRAGTVRDAPEGGEAQLLLAAAVARQRAEGLDVLGVEGVVDRRGRRAAPDVLRRSCGGGEGGAAGSVVCVHISPNDLVPRDAGTGRLSPPAPAARRSGAGERQG